MEIGRNLSGFQQYGRCALPGGFQKCQREFGFRM